MIIRPQAHPWLNPQAQSDRLLDQYGFWWNRGAIRQSHEFERQNKARA
jgi:hypothetical protein